MPNIGELTDQELEVLRREVMDEAENRRVREHRARRNEQERGRVLRKMRGILRDYLENGGDVAELHAQLDREVADLGPITPGNGNGRPNGDETRNPND